MSQSNTEFDWSEFLSFGEQLTSSNDSEVSLRCAISRVYYAAHHTAKTYVSNTLGIRLSSTGEVHKEVIDELLRMNAKRKAGLQLRQLRDKRNWADYDARTLSVSEWTTAISWARFIITSLTTTDATR